MTGTMATDLSTSESNLLFALRDSTLGNLVKDNEKGVSIEWTSEGKVRKVDLQAGESVTTFRYDAKGNRVEKKVVRGDTTTITRYLRDLHGNVVNIYDDTTLVEQPVYGISRIGLYSSGGEDGKSILGLRNYELTNHLGNILSVITDKLKIGNDSITANVVSVTGTWLGF